MSFQNFTSHIEFMKFCQNQWSLLCISDSVSKGTCQRGIHRGSTRAIDAVLLNLKKLPFDSRILARIVCYLQLSVHPPCMAYSATLQLLFLLCAESKLDKGFWFGLKRLNCHVICKFCRYFLATKEERQEVCQSIDLAFLHNRRCFLDTIKGLLSCFKLLKTGSSVYRYYRLRTVVKCW